MSPDLGSWHPRAMCTGIKTAAKALAGILALALAVALVLWGVKAALTAILDGVDPTVGAALITVIGTVIVSLASVGLTRRHEKKKETEQRIREAKVPVYADLINIMFRVMDASAKGATPEAITADIVTEMRRITAELVAWASPSVVQSWSRFRRGAEHSNWTGMEAALALERVLVAIREDIGHSVEGLETGDLLALFMSGINSPAGSTIH